MIDYPDKIQDLIDKSEIQEALARYAICADTGDAEGFASIFTEDALWEWPQANKRIIGRPALKALAEAIQVHCPGAQHAINNTIIELNDQNARVICQFSCFLSRPEQIYTIMLGYYEDKFRKVDGKWLISKRSVRVENPEILGQGKIGEYYQSLAAALDE